MLRQAAILSGSDLLDLPSIEPHLTEAGVAESQALDHSIRAWAARRRAAGASSAELREDLLDRLGKIENGLDIQPIGLHRRMMTSPNCLIAADFPEIRLTLAPFMRPNHASNS